MDKCLKKSFKTSLVTKLQWGPCLSNRLALQCWSLETDVLTIRIPTAYRQILAGFCCVRHAILDHSCSNSWCVSWELGNISQFPTTIAQCDRYPGSSTSVLILVSASSPITLCDHCLKEIRVVSILGINMLELVFKPQLTTNCQISNHNQRKPLKPALTHLHHGYKNIQVLFS